MIQLSMVPAPERPLSLQALQCLSHIRRSKDKDGRARIGRETLARRLHKSPRQVSRYLVELQEHGVIKVTRDPYRLRVNEYELAGTPSPASHPFSYGQEVTSVSPGVVTQVSRIGTQAFTPKTTSPADSSPPAIQTKAEGVSKKESPDELAARLRGLGLYHLDDIELVRRELHVRTGLRHPDAYAFKRLEVLTSKRQEAGYRRKMAETAQPKAEEPVIDLEREKRAAILCSHGIRQDVWCERCANGAVWERCARKEFFPEAPSEEAGGGVVLPDCAAADVAPQGVRGAVAGDKHDGVLAPPEASSGGAEASPQGVAGVAPLQAGAQSDPSHGLADGAGGHGAITEVAVPVDRANESSRPDAADLQPSPDSPDRTATRIALVGDANQAALADLVGLSPGQGDEEALHGVLDVLHLDASQVVTPRADDEPKGDEHPVPVASEAVREALSDAEDVSRLEGQSLLLGTSQAVPDALEDLGDQPRPGRAFKSTRAVRLRDGSHLSLYRGHFVTRGAQVRDVPPDGHGVRGEGHQAGASTPQPEGLQVQPVGLSGGVRLGARGEGVGLGVQALEVHRVTEGELTSDD